jgi:hypothetical protein
VGPPAAHDQAGTSSAGATDWPASLRWEPDLGARDVNLSRVTDIAFTPMEPGLRNELITRTYGDLADSMAELLGTENATWTAFGQWASHTIGSYLRLPIPGLGPMIAQAFGDGNRDVFADIARAHITFLDTVGGAHRRGDDLDEAWRRCIRGLNRDLFHPPGGPDGGTEDEFWASIRDPRLELGARTRNQFLILGFRSYRNALTEPDPERKARLILLGNCLIGLHEQRLLSLAISVGFRSWLRTLTTLWQLFTTRYRWRHRYPGTLRLRIENWWIHFATRHVIGVSLPTGTVRVGRPVPPGARPISITPAPSDTVTPATAPPGAGPQRRPARPILDVDEDELLTSLMDRLGVDGGPASCWNDLSDRMAFIAALFAERQRDPDWFGGDGLIIRPEPSIDLDRELARHAERIADRPEPDEPASVPSPLSDRQLDFLRTRSPDLARLARQDLDYDSIVDGPGRQALAPIKIDFERRHRRLTRPGGLLDPATCYHARNLFRGNSTIWFLGLLMRSLPESYNSAIGAHALGLVSDLATDAFRRTGETARFVLDILADDEGWRLGRMVPDGPAYRSVVGVRCMHAIVALRLGRDHWDHRRFGAPINLEDLLGAALSFCVPPIEMLDDLGVSLPPEARNTYVRFWLGIGVLLGLPEDMVHGPDGRCLDYHQALALSRAIRRRHHARSVDGVRLTEALLVGMVDGFPRFAGWLAPGLMQVMGRDRVGRQLMISVGPGRRRAAVVAAVFSWSLRLRPLRPAVRRLVQSIGRRWIMPFVDQGRTRPYRRPLQADDDQRILSELRSADYWPVDCKPGAARSHGADRRSVATDSRSRSRNEPDREQERHRRLQQYLAPQGLWLLPRSEPDRRAGAGAESRNGRGGR